MSVARKTDAALWPPLFAAVGEPSALAEGLLSAGALHRAACALLIVDRLQGSATAHELALRLMQVTHRWFCCALSDHAYCFHPLMPLACTTGCQSSP